MSPNWPIRSSSNLSKLIFSLSILFTNMILGVSYFSRFFHAFSVPTSIPEEPSTRRTEPSLALLAPYISPIKSKYPGVSSILNLVLFHSTGITDVPIETCLAISCLSKSDIVFPSVTFPCLVVTPVANSIASVKVVFPLLLCPRRATFLIFSVEYAFKIHSP